MHDPNYVLYMSERKTPINMLNAKRKVTESMARIKLMDAEANLYDVYKRMEDHDGLSMDSRFKIASSGDLHPRSKT